MFRDRPEYSGARRCSRGSDGNRDALPATVPRVRNALAAAGTADPGRWGHTPRCNTGVDHAPHSRYSDLRKQGNRAMRVPGTSASIAFALSLAGCTTVGQVRNIEDPSCSAAFERELASILVAQHESSADAEALAASTRAMLASIALGPRPFMVSAPSGTDYSLFVEPTDEGCLLRLCGRQKGFTSYTNNITWIETRPLPACRCTP